MNAEKAPFIARVEKLVSAWQSLRAKAVSLQTTNTLFTMREFTVSGSATPVLSSANQILVEI